MRHIAPGVAQAYQHGLSCIRSGIGRGNTKREQPRSDTKIGCARKPKVLECHNLGRCHVKGWHIMGVTRFFHCLLENVALGHAASTECPFMVQSGQLLVIRRTTQQQQMVCDNVINICVHDPGPTCLLSVVNYAISLRSWSATMYHMSCVILMRSGPLAVGRSDVGCKAGRSL
jgi:hypothetical protein